MDLKWLITDLVTCVTAMCAQGLKVVCTVVILRASPPVDVSFVAFHASHAEVLQTK